MQCHSDSEITAQHMHNLYHILYTNVLPSVQQEHSLGGDKQLLVNPQITYLT
jgi:hypothetical protein